VLFVAAKLWPSTSVNCNNLSPPLPKAEQLWHLTAEQLRAVEVMEMNSQQGEAMQSTRARAALGWAEITCLCSSQELDLPSAHKVNVEGGMVGVTNNASSACHQQSNLPLLLGYLSRRYQHRGN
jgi:hypothetical protein